MDIVDSSNKNETKLEEGNKNLEKAHSFDIDSEVASEKNPVADSPVETFSKSKPRWRRIISFINVEPAYFTYCVAYACMNILITDFLFFKACHSNLDLDVDYCKSNKTKNDDVAEVVADIKIWQEVLESFLTVILFLFIGAWSDAYGRKFPMLLAILGYLVQCIGMLICDAFDKTPAEAVAVAAVLPTALTGQIHSILWAILSFVADTTSVVDRTLKMGLISCTFSFGNSAGAALAGLLKRNQVDYTVIFGLGGTLHVLAFTYILFVIKNTGKGGGSSSNSSMLSYRHILGTAKTFFRKREGRNRLYLMLLVVAYMCTSISYSGERVVLQQFAYKHIGWLTEDYSDFKTFQNILPTIGELLALALLVKLWKLQDSSLAVVSCTSMIGGSLVFAFADRTWHMYLAPVVSIVNGAIWTTTRSSISKIIPTSEIGKVNSFVGLFSTLAPLATDPVYAAVFRVTLHSFPGTFFFVSIAVTIPPILIFLFLYREARRNK